MLDTTKDDRRLARGRRWFEYHCWENEKSCDADLWHHTHQQVILLEKEESDYGEPLIYLAKFADGFTYTIFEDELVKSPSDFYRPNYKKE